MNVLEKNKKFNISYLDKTEATFILGKLKYSECTSCPDFYRGCDGNLSHPETASMNDKIYISQHIRGTENYLCGKLRNIVNLSLAEEQQLNNEFEGKFNQRVSMLSRKGDKKYVLIEDVDEYENIAKSIQKQIASKFDQHLNHLNEENNKVIQDMLEKINITEQIIAEQQLEIDSLKNKK
jgi:hypothetical protein